MMNNRKKEEKLVKELNILTARLLRAYQWDHLVPNYQEIAEIITEINEKTEEINKAIDG